MSLHTTLFCNLLLPSYAIFCHCTIHDILKIGKEMHFYIQRCLSQVFVILPAHYHLALISAPPISARKYWTLNSLWSWWELRTPSTSEDGVRKDNKKLSPSKLSSVAHCFSDMRLDSFALFDFRENKLNEERTVVFLLLKKKETFINGETRFMVYIFCTKIIYRSCWFKQH